MQGCLKLVLLMKFSSTRKKKKRSTSVRFSEETTPLHLQNFAQTVSFS
jgi:hypothetical protein